MLEPPGATSPKKLVPSGYVARPSPPQPVKSFDPSVVLDCVLLTGTQAPIGTPETLMISKLRSCEPFPSARIYGPRISQLVIWPGPVNGFPSLMSAEIAEKRSVGVPISTQGAGVGPSGAATVAPTGLGGNQL